MKNEFYIHFESGMPKGTAQQKGETIRYKRVGNKMLPYIEHYRTAKVQAMRNLLILKMKRYRPELPSDKPIRLKVVMYFDVKDKRLWGTYKDTKVDIDNYYKELADVMTLLKFWKDDSQVVDLRLIKYYSEKASIHICMEEIEDG